MAVDGLQPTPLITVKKEGDESETPELNENQSGGITTPAEILGIQQSDESTIKLSGEFSEPQEQISQYQWIIIGPLPQPNTSLDNLSFDQLASILAELPPIQSPILSLTGQRVEVERPASGEFYLTTLTTITESGNWSTTVRPVSVQQNQTGAECPLSDDPSVDETSARGVLEQIISVHNYQFTGNIDQINSVRTRADCPDIDLGITTDGRSVDRITNADRFVRGADSDEEITNLLGAEDRIGVVVGLGGLTRVDSVEYYVTVETEGPGVLERVD